MLWRPGDYDQGKGRRDRTQRPSNTDLSPPGATPTLDTLPRRASDFETLGQALDYAATGSRGLNFHDARGTLTRAYSYAELREDRLRTRVASSPSA